MSKGKARLLGYLFFGIASVCLAFNQYLLMMLIGVPSLVLIWLYIHKDVRDKEFITQAQLEREKSFKTPAQAPTMSEKSRGLFLPKPLN